MYPRLENISIHKDLYLNIIHNSQKVEMIQMSINGKQINVLWYIHAMEYYSAIKSNKLIIHSIIQMNFKSEIAGNKDLYTFHYRKFQKKKLSEQRAV